MLTPYYGEFLIIPMPLEFSFNPCSNDCSYCFSNLNKYKNKTNEQSVLNKLSKFREKQDTVSKLLQKGYAICFSNKSDPFCASNIDFSIKFLEIATELDIDIAYQTKCSKRIPEILSFVKPAIWYVTLSQDNESARQRVEKNTIPIEERLKLIKEIVKKGHKVNVGINPFVPEWINNQEDFIKKIKDAGAYGITVEGLHFSHEQKVNFKNWQRQALGEEIIARSLKREPPADEKNEYLKICDIIKKQGIDLWSFWNRHVSKMWDPYFKRYKCFPIVTNFINYVIQNKKDGDILTFKDFVNYSGGSIPNFEYKIESYVMSIARNIYREKQVPKTGTFLKLMYIFWSENRIKTCPAQHPFLSVVVRKNEYNDLEYVMVDGQYPVMMYNSKGFKSMYVFEDGSEVI